ncbi:MAG: hypothetical protein K0Q79_666 [Flavipsychrobacter sp.]|jgi:hypothetical protein|nr:hypothetical protein [Flavipsychrobacter sp.]
MLKVYLTKQNRKTIDFVLFEADGKFVCKSSGKIGKSGIANSTLNAGSSEKAIAEIHNETKELLKQGFVISKMPDGFLLKDIVFDKAKWHVTKNFPESTDLYQSYVHTGLYICWLIEKDLYETDFKAEHIVSLHQLLNRQISPAKFYETELDGIFDSEGLTQKGIRFTLDYFDFEKGQYLTDYFRVLDPNDNLQSMFHIEDTWKNYDKLKVILDKKFEDWNQKINTVL